MSMDLFATAVLNGVINGSMYAILGLAIVLIFRTTGVSNFAQGEMSMFSVFVLIMVSGRLPIPFWAQWLATVAISGVLAAAIYLAILKPNSKAEPLNLTVRTLGLYMLIYAVALYTWGAKQPYQVPSIFRLDAISILGLSITYDQLGTLGVTAVLGALLFVVFRYTAFGLAMRAVAINAEMAQLLGVNVTHVTLAVWLIAGALGAVVGMLIAPVTFLEADLMRPYILKAFTAAIMGGFYSFPGLIVGAFLLGISESLAATWFTIHLREPFTFAILLIVMLVRPAGLFGHAHQARV